MVKFVTALIEALRSNCGKVAIYDRNATRQTTYKDLYEESLRTVSYLNAHNIPQGSCITIRLPKSMEYFAAEIGCWMAGCTVVPLSDHFPRERVDYIVNHCKASLIIDEKVMQEAHKLQPVASSLCEMAGEEASVAALFYTSGSTGNPKGVVLTFESMYAGLMRNVEITEMQSDDIAANSAPMYFIASITDYVALAKGATIHIYPDNVRSDVQLMEQYIEQNKITFCFMSPTMLAQYTAPSPYLRLVITGSERVSGLCPDGLRLRNVYGQTETLGGTLYFDIDKAYDNTPIGHTTAGVELSVQDEDGNILEDGEEGEICLKGCFSPGYYKDEERTSELYRDGWLHSGDLGKVTSDGNVIYVNRKDWMVKISGQRVEPGEVEAVIKRCPGVKDAVVKGFQSRRGSTYLCAFWIPLSSPEAEAGITEQQIEDFLKERLPEYMVPTCYARMESFPINANGKIDRKNMQSPLESTEQDFANEQLTSLESEIRQMVGELIGTNHFGSEENLAFIGMTSISSAKLAAEVYKKYDVLLDAKKFVRSATVKSIAAFINSAEKAITNTDGAQITESPLTFSQQGVYAECINNPDNVSYNIPFAVKLPSGVTIEELKQALCDIVAAHPYINCHFTSNDEGDTIQKAREDNAVDIPVKEISVDEFEQEKKSFVCPFDLANGPCYRFEIVKAHLNQLFLLVDFHHLIADGGSMDVFFTELCKVLNGEKLDIEKYNYYQFANNQTIDEETEQFFEEKMSLIEEASQLLPDVYEPAGGHRMKSVHHPTDLQGVEMLSRDLNITPAAVFLGATAVAVSKYVAEEMVGFCTISNGRANSLITGNIGMFVNTLPLVFQIQGQQSVKDYLHDVAENFAATIAHENYPYARIAEKYQFADNIMFAYQVGLINHYKTKNGELNIESLELDVAQNPVSVLIEDTPDGGAQVRIEYDADLFTEEMMMGLAQSVNHVVTELSCKETLADIDVCDDAQIAGLDSFNNPIVQTEEEKQETVLSAFQKAARQYPDHIAGKFKDKAYTYRELDELTDKIACAIYNKVKDCGSAEPVISIIIPRNEYMFILPLAAMKAGCAYQPLDPSYPQERLNFMVKDANAVLLIADPELRNIVNEYEGEVILTSELGDGSLMSADAKKTATPHHLTAASLLILLYTSGSTGVPKGVMLEHGNVMAYIRCFQKDMEMTPDSVMASYASFGFDACMEELYSALTLGATVCLIPEEIRLDIIALRDFAEENGVTYLDMTTQVGQQFALNVEGCKTVKHLILGGEKMMAMEPHPDFLMHNTYGPTECAICVTLYPVRKYEPNIPIGKPTTTTTLKIVDKNFHRVPVGAAGELWVNGPQVSRGYLNRPDKTAESFVIHEGKRWYRTGDIVRYRNDGNIEFVGRKDGQVKIRGFRIELKEVEEIIHNFHGIKDVTVQAFDDPNGGKFIAAYIVSDCEVNINDLNNFILEEKPPYMVPAVTMQIEKIPLNVNQKVDKKALPAPDVKLKVKGDELKVAAPLNALEKELHDIIAGVVSLPLWGESEGASFGITDVLGYIGLTSISGIKLATLIYKKYGVQVNAKSLAKTGTLQSIENEILEHWMKGDVDDATPKAEVSTISLSKKEDRGGAALASSHLSFSQIGVYTDCQSHPDSIQYNIPMFLLLPEATEAEEVKRALATLLEAHPYLDNCFVDGDDGEPAQCLKTGVTLEIPVKELTPEQFEQEKKDFVRPFNLSKDTLYRFEIVEVKSLQSSRSTLYLLCDFHHLIMDGASVDIFVTHLCAALDGEPVEHEMYDYYQFVADQKIEAATEEFFATQLGQIEEASALLPDIYGGDDSHRPLIHEIPTDLSAAELFSRRLNVTPAALYLAAILFTVSKYTAEDTVGICTISNGRSNLRIADTFGMFVNTLPLVGKIDASMRVEDFVMQVADTFAATMEHEDYPFAKIAENYNYAVNIMYAYQVGIESQYSTQKGAVTSDTLELKRAKFPVAIYVDGSIEEGGILRVEYDSSLFSAAMMEGLASAINNVVKQLTVNSVKTLGEVELCNAEQLAVLDTFNHPVPNVPEDTVIAAFQRAAKEYPDNVAAVYKDKKYTYKELDELTDKIGSLIYNKVSAKLSPMGGVGGDCPVVSILIPRNEYVFILPLAAMKAGCAYQPLDPSYPQERLNFMVKDADAALLIADLELRDIINEYEGEVILTSDLSEDKLPTTVTINTTPLVPKSLFILLYTSGSTGVPKGVMLEHQNIMEFIAWYRRYYDLKPEHNVAAYASFGFDANMMDLYPALTTGATVHIIGEDIRLNLMALNAYFEAHNVTHCFMTTQVGVQFLQNADNHSLKHLSIGGEKLMSVEPSDTYQLHNAYGPTECSIFTTIFPVDHKEPNIPIGKPLDSHICYVMDKNLHRLPIGAAGELVIVGKQVGRGYLNRPDKTAEAFFTIDGQRAYHSGDIVRYRQDGNIEFVGRKDGQVKIRGFRIELKEVEAVIRDFDGVKDVTVQAYNYEDGTKYIAAFVVSEKSLDIEALYEFIKSQKPPYMVPAVTMQIDQIPLNVNQKVDKKALPTPEAKKAEYVAPTSNVEKDFCEIFETVLGAKQVSATDDFFEIGGSSIIALKLVVAANKKNYDIVYNDVFSYTTPRAIAEFISVKNGEQLTVNNEQLTVNNEQLDKRSYIGADGFDYRPLNALLKQNTLENFISGERQPIGDVLLTGATGFLGIHVLYELITNYDSRIYCFVRRKGTVGGEQRLRTQLFYYFEKSFSDLFGKRIFVIEGDATSEEDMRSVDCPASVVVNCAACVKHFAKDDEIERMNVGSVRNLIAWCLEHNARLVHISTGSVAGDSINGFPPADYQMREQELFFGQDLSNQYAHSKFMAERYILDAISHHGLNAHIMRVGNLSPRNKDGEFQINFRSNNFMSMLASFQFMGVFPYAMFDKSVEFSPIDATAKAIMLLAQAPKECIVLHPFNVHVMLFGDVMTELSNYGRQIRLVENSVFGSRMNELLEDMDNVNKLRPLMAYNSDSKTVSSDVGYNSSYTAQLLYRMGFRWPITTWDYVQRFIQAVGGMGMFGD